MTTVYNTDCLPAMRAYPDKHFGLDFVGYEIDKVYFDLQEEAFEAYTAQMRMQI